MLSDRFLWGCQFYDGFEHLLNTIFFDILKLHAKRGGLRDYLVLLSDS